MSRSDLLKRVVEEAETIAKFGWTVRMTANHFKVSKSTVHRDVTKVLPKLGRNELYKQVRRVLDFNKSERAARGGAATRAKVQKTTPKGAGELQFESKYPTKGCEIGRTLIEQGGGDV